MQVHLSHYIPRVIFLIVSILSAPVRAQLPAPAAAALAADSAASRTTALVYRMIASAGSSGGYDTDTLRANDSSRYVYSGIRRDSDFDTLTYYAPEFATLPMSPLFRTSNTFDANGLKTVATSESRIAGKLEYTAREQHFRDAAGIDTLMLTDQFNAAGSAFGPYQASRIRYYNYSSGKVLWETLEQWKKASGTYDTISWKRHTYDAAGNELSYAEDLRSGTAPLLPRRQIFYTYTNTNKLQSYYIKSYAAGTWTITDSVVYRYDAADSCVLRVTESYDNGAPDTRRVQSWAYYPAGKLRAFADSTWDLTNLRWISGLRARYAYNAANQEETAVNESEYNGIWQPTDSNRSIYRPNSTTYLRFLYRPAAWVPGSEYTYNYSASGKTDTLLIRQKDPGADTLVNSTLQIYLFDSLDRMKRTDLYTWAGGSWSYRLGSQRRFYYESYNDGVGVPAQGAGPVSSFTIAPVPASDRLHIRFTTDRPAHFTAAISDISGRVLRRWSGSSGVAVDTVPVRDLAPGTYQLTIEMAGGSTSRRFTVVP